jgi:hypothetical protein
LFVGFELLQGNVLVALEHLQKGIGIIGEHFKQKLEDYASHQGTVALSVAPDHLIDELVPAFSRLDYVRLLTSMLH